MKNIFLLAFCSLLMLFDNAFCQPVFLDPWQKVPNAKFKAAPPTDITEFQAFLPSGELANYKKVSSQFLIQTSKGLKYYKDSSDIFMADSSYSILFLKKGAFTGYAFTNKSEYQLTDSGTVEKADLSTGKTPEVDATEPPKALKKKARKHKQPKNTMNKSVGFAAPPLNPYGRDMIAKTIVIRYDVAYNVFKARGLNRQSVIDEVQTLFLLKKELYRREGINLKLGTVFIWETPDPYASLTSAYNVLYKYTEDNMAKKPVNEQWTFLDLRNWGGIAWINTIGSDLAFAFCGISTYQISLNYSAKYFWSWYCDSHESGHNCGSQHTQWCGWVDQYGKQVGRLDKCYAGEASGNAPCSSTTGCDSTGSVMSYCHISSCGIDMQKGFTMYPRKAIRTGLYNSPIPFDSIQQPVTCTSFDTVWSSCVNGVKTLISSNGKPLGCTGSYNGPTTKSCANAVKDTSSIIFYFNSVIQRYRATLFFSKEIGIINVCRYSAGTVDSLPIPTGFPPSGNCGRRTTPAITSTDRSKGFIDFELSPQPGNWPIPPTKCSPCGNLWYVVKRTTSTGDTYSNKIYIRGK